jgi:hypothetical protein
MSIIYKYCCVMIMSLALPVYGAENLKIVVLQGDRVANVDWHPESEPIVRVENAEGHPVSGAIVEYQLPTDKSGGEFGIKKGRDKSHTMRQVVTGSDGFAKAGRIKPSKVAGKYQLMVRATYGSDSSSVIMTRENIAKDAVEQSRRPIGKKATIILGAVLGAIILVPTLSKL